MRWLLLVAALSLSGCGPETLARWHSRGVDTEMAGWNYVTERWSVRQEIRRRCIESLWREVNALEESGQYALARQVLRDNYPPLLTMDAIDAYQEGDITSWDRPYGCG